MTPVPIPYIYKAQILDVHDGDTCRVQVDMGLDEYRNLILRLYGINAPELSTPEGKAAQVYALSLLPLGSSVVINTIKDRREKYGRYLAIIYLADGTNFNDLMVSTGHAVIYFG